MNLANLLARLNPTTVRYDASSGGVPELTPQDIAGALGMVPAGLGRELVCRLWWPDGARLTAKDLDRMLMDAQLAEWKDRMDGLITAQIAFELADDRFDKARADGQKKAAKARIWPRLGPDSCYAAIRVCVLDELSKISLCSRCQGRGTNAANNGVLKTCTACEGWGRVKWSDRGRADRIERDEATYRRIWRPVYEWTFRLCQDELTKSTRSLQSAIGLAAVP